MNVLAVLSLKLYPLSNVVLFEFTAFVCSSWTQLLLRESVCHLRQVTRAIESPGKIWLSAGIQAFLGLRNSLFNMALVWFLLLLLFCFCFDMICFCFLLSVLNNMPYLYNTRRLHIFFIKELKPPLQFNIEFQQSSYQWAYLLSFTKWALCSRILRKWWPLCPWYIISLLCSNLTNPLPAELMLWLLSPPVFFRSVGSVFYPPCSVHKPCTCWNAVSLGQAHSSMWWKSCSISLTYF